MRRLLLVLPVLLAACGLSGPEALWCDNNTSAVVRSADTEALSSDALTDLIDAWGQDMNYVRQAPHQAETLKAHGAWDAACKAAYAAR